jgi:hypothetical protein
MAEEKEIRTAEEGLHKAGATMKEGIVDSLKGVNEIESEIVSLARNTVSNTLQASGDVAKVGIGEWVQRAWPRESFWASATSEVIW